MTRARAPAPAQLVLLVGLTGAGKSTAVAALQRVRTGLVLLPNRRELADLLVIPEAQRLDGLPPAPVTDRVQRFRLTARYRHAHPGGLAYALQRYLAGAAGPPHAAGTALFDNLRGRDEVAFAASAFPAARFVVLDADPLTRALRLAGRGDAFDRAGPAGANPSASVPRTTARTNDGPRSGAGAPALLARLAQVPHLPAVLDPAALARAAAGADPDALETAARVVAEEGRHYDPAAAWDAIAHLHPRRRIRLDTSELSPGRVVERLIAWW